MSISSKRSSKSIGDDPLGKKINDFLGLDEDISNMDLSKNNDVFYEENTDDSFNIEFKNESCTENEMQESDVETNQIEDLSITDDNFDSKNGNIYKRQLIKNASKSTTTNSNKRILRSRMSTKLVGIKFEIYFYYLLISLVLFHLFSTTFCKHPLLFLF